MIYKRIDITSKEIFFECLPKEFDGCRILHISDLHNCILGDKQKRLIQLSRQQKPDYVFITGDMIDQYHEGMEHACTYIRGLVEFAPVFCVTGNHEWEANKKREEFFDFLQQEGVRILQDEFVKLTRGNGMIQLAGIDDPYIFYKKINMVDDCAFARDFLIRFCTLNRKMGGEFTVLLSHRPEFIHYYAKARIDLVFSGHAHGGQFRLPVIGNIWAPHQGLFPKYAEGLISEKDTFMVVSRGLGDSRFPVRIGNNPELVVVTLRTGRKAILS